MQKIQKTPWLCGATLCKSSLVTVGMMVYICSCEDALVTPHHLLVTFCGYCTCICIVYYLTYYVTFTVGTVNGSTTCVYQFSLLCCSDNWPNMHCSFNNNLPLYNSCQFSTIMHKQFVTTLGRFLILLYLEVKLSSFSLE